MSEEARKFFKTVIRVEVLSEDTPIDEGVSLSELDYAITDGDCSGRVERVSVKKLTGKQVVKALAAQGSDASFFMLNEDGNDIDEDDEED